MTKKTDVVESTGTFLSKFVLNELTPVSKATLNPYRSSLIEAIKVVIERLCDQEEENELNKQEIPLRTDDEILAFKLMSLLNLISLFQESTSHYTSQDSQLTDEQVKANTILNARLNTASFYLKIFNQFHQQRQQPMSPGEPQSYFQPAPMPAVFFPQAMSPRVPGEQQPPNIADGMSNKFVGGQGPFVVLSPPPPLPPQQPVPGFHPISMMPRIYMEPVRANVCLAGPPFMPMQQQQQQSQPVSPPMPIFYSTSPPMTPWLAAPPPAYFMVPNTQPHTPFQQLI